MPDDSALSKREKELFSNQYQEDVISRKIKLSSRTAEIPHSWGSDTPIHTPTPSKGRSLGMLFFLASILVFLVAAVFTGWKFLNHGNVVSSANITIDITMKDSVEGGEAVPLAYSIQNKNALPLLSSTLFISYEKGTGAQDEQNKIREKIDLGDIASQVVRKGEVTIQLYGPENTTRTIEARLEYKVEGSNAVFNKIVTVNSILKTPPVSVHVDAPARVISEQQFPITVTVKNNVATTSESLVAQVVLPPNYFVINSDPVSSKQKGTVWQFTNLIAGEEKKIVLNGYFKALPGEMVSVKAVVGSQGMQAYDIGNVYSFETKGVTIANPGLSVKLSTNHPETGNGVVTFLPGERVSGYVTYVNAADQAITNVNIVFNFNGSKIDPTTVTVDNGYFDSANGTIAWNGGTTDTLKSLAPGAKGTLMFTFMVPQGIPSSAPLQVAVHADADTGDGGEHFSSKDEKNWYIEGGATLLASLKYKDATFSNTGPLPPIANQTTTYTLSLSAASEHGFKNGKVSFSLPLYVTWKNVISGGAVSYDSRNRVVTWSIGDVQINQTAKVSMQLGVKPSITHVGTMPSVTSGITFEGTDASTMTSLKRVMGMLTTHVDDVSNKDISTVIAPTQ